MKIAQKFTVNSLRVALHAVKFSTPETLCNSWYKRTSFYNILNN